MPAAASPLPATAVRGVNVRQRLPVISRLTRSLRILGPSEWASLFTRIKAKLLMVVPDGLDIPAARRQIPLGQKIEALREPFPSTQPPPPASRTPNIPP